MLLTVCDSNSIYGYSTTARQARESIYPFYSTVSAPATNEWKQHTSYDFTGCIAHADLTYTNGKLRQAIGIFCHNSGCLDAVKIHERSKCLHLHVKEIALNQLCDGARYAPVVFNCYFLGLFFYLQHYIS